MNRRDFLHSVNVDYDWPMAWSFLRPSTKSVIFPLWDAHEKNGVCLMLSEEWRLDARQHVSGKFTRALKHVQLVEEEGWTLETFIQVKGGEKPGGSWFIKEVVPPLQRRQLVKLGHEWFAILPGASIQDIPEELSAEDADQLSEGGKSQVTVNAYERNPEARARCLAHYGHACSVCGFEFGKEFGKLGENYIHVHHLVPVSKRGGAYIVDPIKDLRPVCPNCHAMLHRTRDPRTIEEIKEIRSRTQSP